MDQPIEKDELAPEKRSVRRRLIQSTLFPQKPQELESNGGDHNADKDCLVNGDNEDDQDFCCGSQGKKSRKRKVKTTTPPRTKAPNKLKEKTPKKKTPKKNGKISNDSVENEDASPPSIPNLRLEAKLKAEEYSRMFAGKQLHPFFSSWKAEKKNQSGKEVDTNCSSSGKKDTSTTIGPIHVFERSQDEVVSIDWSNWTFYKETVDHRSCVEGIISPVFDNSTESLKLDKLHCVPYSNNTSSNQCHSEERLKESSPEVSVLLIDDREDHQLDQIASVSEHAGSKGESDVEEKSSSKESSRILSYYNASAPLPRNSLWTDKYRPKNAMEVCGNSESVKFISEWLHVWHERDVRASKVSYSGDKRSVPDDNHDCYLIDSDSENIDEGDSVKNVLLVTGPIGSGKSAAIHACAHERGFKVLENNASDCRQGTVVKQKFGGALESNCLRRSVGNPLDSPNKNIMKSFQTQSNGEAAQQVDEEVIEVIPISDEENSHGPMGKLDNDVKPLILIEDVDVFFPEDRGFIAAIQQIAEKAKGPVILTSNSNNISLSDNLERQEVSFTMPTPKDLLSHLYMICVAEKVDLQPRFLEQLIVCCQADIRKTIMHLQFWCQNKRCGKDKKIQKLYEPKLFDPEAGHHMLPKIIPWDFPSQLSELVDKEVMKSLSLMEENSILREGVEGEGHEKMPSKRATRNNPADSVAAKKEEMLNRNSDVRSDNELEDPLGSGCDLSNFPQTPVSFSRRNIRRKFNVVTSSDSEDELFLDKSPVEERNINNELIFVDLSRLPSHLSNAQNCQSPPTDKLLYPVVEKLEGNHYLCSEVANDLQIGTCKSADVSCVPESSFVPETEIDNGLELSRTVCSGYIAETVESSMANLFDLNLPPVEDNNSLLEIHRNPDMLENICDVTAESSHLEEVEDSHNDHVENGSRTYQLMDECSRMDFKRRSKPIEETRSWEANDLVRESWKKLRESSTDLRQYVTSEKQDAFQILKLTNGMCNLITEADLLLSRCQTQDVSDLPMFPHEDLDAGDWCDEHLQMSSTIMQHGFSIYAKDISNKGLNMISNAADLTREILACTNNIKSSKLCEQDLETSEISVAASNRLLERETKLGLFNRVKSLVPSRSYLALKGYAFHEYLSSVGCILKSEASLISESSHKTKKRRGRIPRHYFSTSALTLSPEDVSVLVQSNSYGKHPVKGW